MSDSITAFINSSYSKRASHESGSEDEGVVPEDITKKILKVARDQLEDEGLASDNYSEASDVEDGQDVEVDDDYEEDDEDVQMEFAKKRVSFAGEEEAKPIRGPGGIDMSEIDTDLPIEVIEHYTRIGKFLSVYTVGKIPKGFKILPTRKQW